MSSQPLIACSGQQKPSLGRLLFSLFVEARIHPDHLELDMVEFRAPGLVFAILVSRGHIHQEGIQMNHAIFDLTCRSDLQL